MTTLFQRNTRSCIFIFNSKSSPTSYSQVCFSTTPLRLAHTQTATSPSSTHSKKPSYLAKTEKPPLRNAPSPPPATKPRLPLSASTEDSSVRSKVNGPISTLPPPLDPASRIPGQNTISYVWALAKSYGKFYKAGVKSTWWNYKLVKPLKKTISSQYNGSIDTAIQAKFLDREKFQLIRRSEYDTRRIPLFALVFAICGEWTPFLVMGMPTMVPYTCRIPKQVLKEREKLERRRGISFRNLTVLKPEGKGYEWQDLERMQLLHISWSLGLSSSLWDWLGGQLPGLPTAILRRRVGRRVKYLEDDDRLILRDGGINEMDLEEVKIALSERGVDFVGKKDQKLKRMLKAWLSARETVPIEQLLVTRPSVWPNRHTTAEDG